MSSENPSEPSPVPTELTSKGRLPSLMMSDHPIHRRSSSAGQFPSLMSSRPRKTDGTESRVLGWVQPS
jgi:hypothetical protein